jgi:hypothetical protein
MVQPPHTCAMCVSEGGLTTGCSGRSAARPAAEPERYLASYGFNLQPMDRALDPVFSRARDTIETVLDSLGYQLAAESHYPDAFGSAHAEYRGHHERIRLTWDGKDRFLGLSVARTASSNQHPGEMDWRPLEPALPSATSQFLRPGPVTEARIIDLVAAIRDHRKAAV